MNQRSNPLLIHINIPPQPLLCGISLIQAKQTIKYSDQIFFTIESNILYFIQEINRNKQFRYIHRNVKPSSNFLIGIGQKAHKVYIIDFRLAKRNPFDKVFRACCCTMGRSRSFEGSERFASISSHYTFTQINQDDLESLGYIMIYFLKGRLPWQNCRASNTLERQQKIANEKMTTSIKDLCEGLPQEFSTYLEHVRISNKINKTLTIPTQGLYSRVFSINQDIKWTIFMIGIQLILTMLIQLNHISMTGILLK